MLLVAVGLCGLVWGSTQPWIQSSQLCRRHDREYTVCFSLSNPWNVLTMQGSHWFSHTVALFTLALSGSHAHPAIFTPRSLLLQLFQLCKLSGEHARSWIVKKPDAEVRLRFLTHACCGQQAYISHKFSHKSGRGKAEVESDWEKRGGKGEGEL